MEATWRGLAATPLHALTVPWAPSFIPGQEAHFTGDADTLRQTEAESHLGQAWGAGEETWRAEQDRGGKGGGKESGQVDVGAKQPQRHNQRGQRGLPAEGGTVLSRGL